MENKYPSPTIEVLVPSDLSVNEYRRFDIQTLIDHGNRSAYTYGANVRVNILRSVCGLGKLLVNVPESPLRDMSPR